VTDVTIGQIGFKTERAWLPGTNPAAKAAFVFREYSAARLKTCPDTSVWQEMLPDLSVVATSQDMPRYKRWTPGLRSGLNPLPSLWHHLSMPKIHIPTPLRQYAGKQPAVDVKGSTVGEALSGLVSDHPDLRRHLYTEDGKLRAFVNVYLNDEDVRYLQKEATAVRDGDNISIVPSIAGGSALSC